MHLQRREIGKLLREGRRKSQDSLPALFAPPALLSLFVLLKGRKNKGRVGDDDDASADQRNQREPNNEPAI